MFFKRKKVNEVVVKCEYNMLKTYYCTNKIRIAYINCVIKDDDTIHICDIVHDNTKAIDKGIGTEMMNALIEYARNNNYSEITGDLSVVDADHKDRLHHFYSKFGFEITVFDSVINNYYGCIAMKL